MRRPTWLLCRERVLLIPLCVPLCWMGLAANASEFANGVPVGQIKASNLAELSGLAPSRQNPGVIWVHNDQARGDVFAVSTNGQLLATWHLAQNVSDFEDVAFGPGPLPELHYLYCGDIGDNLENRSNIRVYRAAEPGAYPYQASNPPSPAFPSVEKFTLRYPDGAHNAEALLVDPWTGDLFIATKENARSRIYTATRSQLQSDATITLSLVADVPFDLVSSGDISPDGTEILLRTEDYAMIWRRSSGQTIAQALASVPVEVPVIGRPVEPNGEGIGYAGDGQGYYTVSEGSDPILYFFKRLAPPAVPAPAFLLPPASVWTYKDDGSNQGVAWLSPDFDDSAWPSGRGQFGYGEDDEQTVIKYGPDKDRKFVTSYFRTTFSAAAPALTNSLLVRVLFDDGLALYLNGTEVLRRNLASPASFSDTALDGAGATENVWQTFSLPNGLRAGANILAAEVHRHSRSEGNLSFDLQLLSAPISAQLAFTAPPRRESDGSWTFDFQAPGNASVTLETSTDLLAWTSLGTFSVTNGVGRATVPDCPAPYSFYRLRQ